MLAAGIIRNGTISVIHTCEQKIHVAGQWSRYTANGEKLSSAPIVYIVTRQEKTWGIQARFSTDYAEDGDTADMETRGFKLIHDFINRSNEGNFVACAELINYPHFEIGHANLKSSANLNELKLPKGIVSINSLYAIQTGVHSMNAALDINIAADGQNHLRQLVLNINDRENHLGIQAWSGLNPQEEPLREEPLREESIKEESIQQ